MARDRTLGRLLLQTEQQHRMVDGSGDKVEANEQSSHRFDGEEGQRFSPGPVSSDPALHGDVASCHHLESAQHYLTKSDVVEGGRGGAEGG